MLTGLLFGQDVLTLKNGESYKGTFFGKVDEDIVFKMEGETSTKKFSINDVEIIKIKSGELSYPFSVTNSYILILKNGTTHFGEYSKIEEKIVYFKPQGVGAFQRVPVKQIQTLKLKDGHFIIGDGRNRLTLEEYQKLSTKEKAIYDAKSKNLVKWALYGSISPIIISVYNFFYGKGGPRTSIAFSTAIATIPYFVLNRKEKFNFPKSILTDSEKEIYEQAYSKELQKRKFIHFLGCTIVTGGFLRFIGKYNTSDRSGYDLSGHGTAW